MIEILQSQIGLCRGRLKRLSRLLDTDGCGSDAGEAAAGVTLAKMIQELGKLLDRKDFNLPPPQLSQQDYEKRKTRLAAREEEHEAIEETEAA